MFNAFPILAMTFVLGIHVAPAQAEVTWDIQPDTWWPRMAWAAPCQCTPGQGS